MVIDAQVFVRVAAVDGNLKIPAASDQCKNPAGFGIGIGRRQAGNAVFSDSDHRLSAAGFRPEIGVQTRRIDAGRQISEPIRPDNGS